ncbi:DUF4124 domain-containing protein [Duganella sp. FT80W]|uniref:DUF4124 domain-containing protein n=1 Tax=Duganella guangzhouensis TaxID=2666084 RepID=A0A6I2L0A5_9BURK|nr:DUF4124 domain-containing protein [Duganella guangzhouensis]MRW89976.1 DUF4124 domain-containing protein [Duganella guangzhouensis]
MKYRIKLLAATLLLTTSSLALAQYIWIDDKGVKQLSDRPPPPDVPDKRILKAPGKPIFNPYAPADADTPADAKPPKPATTLAERNADYNKRKTEAAENAQRTAADAQRKADQAANCDAARQNQQALDQGLRLSTYGQNGERGYMDDAQRDDLRKKTQKLLADCK